MDIASRFITAAPSSQAVLDLFAGEWSSAMPAESGLITAPGHAALFDDGRIHWADRQIGFRGKTVLELGPLEGAHSYMLQAAGAASVLAVEANTRAFLKCLCVKEVFRLTDVTFLLGNFVPFLEACESFDAIVASGVLYHMTDPLKVLDLLARRSDRILLWTHYFDPEIVAGRPDRDLFAQPEALGAGRRGAKRLYPEAALNWAGFSGGSESYAVWLDRDTLLGFFAERGYAVTTAFEHPDHPNGPALTICAMRQAP